MNPEQGSNAGKLPFDNLREFRDSYSEYPTQDGEGWLPDRGSFKAGFFACYHKLNPLREAEREKVEKLRNRITGMILSLKIHGNTMDIPFHIEWLEGALAASSDKAKGGAV